MKREEKKKKRNAKNWNCLNVEREKQTQKLYYNVKHIDMVALWCGDLVWSMIIICLATFIGIPLKTPINFLIFIYVDTYFSLVLIVDRWSFIWCLCAHGSVLSITDYNSKALLLRILMLCSVLDHWFLKAFNAWPLMWWTFEYSSIRKEKKHILWEGERQESILWNKYFPFFPLSVHWIRM